MDKDDRANWRAAYARARAKHTPVQGVEETPSLAFLLKLSISRLKAERGIDVDADGVIEEKE